MSQQHDAPSPPPRTYTGARPITGTSLTCPRCGRVYAYPRPDGQIVYCECGWLYRNVDGSILEEFRPRISSG
jgi:hypothetical protein